MPNYCNTNYMIVSKENDNAKVMKFYMDVARGVGAFGGLTDKERECKDEIGEDGKPKLVGKDWAGNVFLACGYSMDEIDSRGFHVRGWKLTIELVENAGGEEGRLGVSIYADMAWNPNIEEMWTLLREKYDGELEAYCIAEEPGNCLYINTDETGKYFKDKYVLDYYDSKSEEGDKIYFREDEEEKFVSEISRLTKTIWLNAAEIFAHEDMVQTLFYKSHPEDNDYLSINEFTPY